MNVLQPKYLLTAAVLYAIVAQWGIAYYNRLIVKVKGFKFTLSPLGGIIRVELTNSNKGSVYLNDLRGAVAYQGAAFGQFNLLQGLELRAKETVSFDIALEISISQLGMQIYNLISQQTGTPLAIEVQGTAVVNGISIPFNAKKGIQLL